MRKFLLRAAAKLSVGNLYLPEIEKTAPAVVLLGSMTFQKEQVPTEYAGRLAKMGFAALVFDPRYRGESGGEPRCWENPMAKVEEVSSAVDFLVTRPEVDASRIAGLANCQGNSHSHVAIFNSKSIVNLTQSSGKNLIFRLATACL